MKNLEEELATLRAQLEKTTVELSSLQNVASSASVAIQGSIKVSEGERVVLANYHLFS